MENRPLKFTDLINLESWQKLQDAFSAISEIGLRTLDCEGNPITTPSGTAEIWRKLGDKCLPTFLGGKETVDLNLSYSCYPGLQNFIIPIKIDSQALGYVIAGPVILVARKQKEEYREAAEKLGISLESLWESLSQVRVISFQRIQTITEVIRAFGNYILKTASRRLSVKEELGELCRTESRDAKNLLETLLRVALQISGADIGSIMMYNPDAQELNIRASKGIPEEVVRNTRVKLGEGISGRAASEKRSYLINSENPDNRLKPYLNRPYIQSSMVLPIDISDNVLGVMNLGALDISPVKFNPDNLEHMNRLIKLTTYAINAPKRA